MYAYDLCLNQEQGHSFDSMNQNISMFLKDNDYSRTSTPTNYSNLDNTGHNDFIFIFG
jgi:hypothetical protein